MAYTRIAPDAPVYQATTDEMEDLAQLVANASSLANKYGAVRIDPPKGWISPPLRMRPDSRFFVRMQTLPAAPFVDTTPPPDSHSTFANGTTKEELLPVASSSDCPTSSKRRRKVGRHVISEEDDEDFLDAIEIKKSGHKEDRPKARLAPSSQPTSALAISTKPYPDQVQPTAQVADTVRPDVPVGLGPSQAEMMMSTAAAARQALSPFRPVEMARRSSAGPVNALELGDSLAVAAEKDALPRPPRFIPTASFSKSLSSAAGAGRRGRLYLPQHASSSAKAAQGVAKGQVEKKATPPSATRKFKIPRSVPNPFPDPPARPAMRSMARGSTMAALPQQRTRFPSRSSINIHLLLNPHEETPSREYEHSSFSSGGPATPGNVRMHRGEGAGGGEGEGGSPNPSPNHELPHTAEQTDPNEAMSEPRVAAVENALELVDEVLQNVDQLAARRAHSSHESRLPQTAAPQLTGGSLPTRDADSKSLSRSFERSGTMYGMSHRPSATETQTLAAVLTHDPEVNSGGQALKTERSSTHAPMNGDSGRLPLRLKLKLRDTGAPSTANVRGTGVKEAIPLTKSRAAPPSRSGRRLRIQQEGPTAAAASAGADAGLKKKKVGRSSNKRRINHVSHLKWDQDETGRLTKPIKFPDSQTPVTLRSYKKKAQAFEEKLRDSILEDSSFDVRSLKILAEKSGEDWMRSPDTLEQIFWTVIEKGVEGAPVVVPYGVDVEVEGAYDSICNSYVEWYGDGGREGQTNRRKKGQARKGMELPGQGDQTKTDGQVAQAQYDVGRALTAPGSSAMHAKEGRKQLRPTAAKSHVGNLNSKGILRHMPRMPGINHSMYYVGQLLSRFCWHVEDAFLNSVSYLHPDSAPKIWYAVPPSHATKFDDYATSNIFADGLLDEVGSGQLLLANKTTMFNPRKLLEAGVEVYRVVHKPGSFVLTAPRGYHAGFNCGYNVAEAVNFANPAWLPVGRDASRFARTTARQLCVPWEYLLFHEAKATRDVTLGKRQGLSGKDLRKDAKTLAEELYQVVTQGERAITAYAKKTNCRIATLNDVPALVQKNQLGPEFGNGAGLVCALCNHSCHFYAEICGSCDDSFEARCVEHFGQGHRLCLHRDHKTILVRRHDPVLVADILTTLEEVAGINRTPAELVERYRDYLRPWNTPLQRSGLRLKMHLARAASRLPPVMADKPKQSRETSRKDKGRKRKKRVEVDVTEDADSEHEGEKKAKRRKVERSRVEVEGGPSTEPVVPVTIPKLEAISDVPDGSSPVPIRSCHIFPGLDRLALKVSYLETQKRASLKPVKEESDDDSEYYVVPTNKRP
eukprot:GFKZ01012543.1.p1 GENE.GFKZ01012543.1~~GFKZ01012543.1.p1  ORF type:complete len:1421 (+),score=160.96 GFKZ01012543.1:319-4263(+)